MTDGGDVVYFESIVISAFVLFALIIGALIYKRFLIVVFSKWTGTYDIEAVKTTPQQLFKYEKHFDGQVELLKSLREELGQERLRVATQGSDLQKERGEKEAALKRLSENRKEFNQQAEHLHSLQSELTQERSMKATLSAKLKNEIEEKEEALKRLSSIMSSRLRDGNPNVVDLSDQNRPVKIGEQFSELYDNQWTDAYGAIETYFGQNMQERDIIKLLLDILEQCFIACKEHEYKQMSLLRDNISIIVSQVTEKATKLPGDLMQRIKEERKMSAIDKLPAYSEVLVQVKRIFSQQQIETDFLDASELEMFVKECLKLCWLMVVQDPPMTMLLQPARNAIDEFKAYKTRGNHVAWVVWPGLLLEEGGAQLMKGVAEFCK